MQSEMTLLTLFLLGFFGGTHCAGMCGGLNTAFALHLPPHIGRIRLVLLMNFGRLCSYAAVGALMGALSQTGMLLDKTHTVQLGLAVAANMLMLLMGLYLAGWSGLAARVENIGKPLWRHLNPYLSRLLPIRSWQGCLAVGVLWGWLPCGLVYNAALYALASGSAGQGGLYLLAFGLGTLPNLLAIGVFAVQLQQVLHRKIWRRAAGLTVCAWALWQLAVLIY